MAKKQTKKKVNRGNSCEHGIPKSKKCQMCFTLSLSESQRKSYLKIEKVTKKLPTSEKRKQLMGAVQSIVDRPHLREDIEAKDTTVHVMNFGTHQVPFVVERDGKIDNLDNYRNGIAKNRIVKDQLVTEDDFIDVPVFKHKKLFKIEVEESKSDWPMLYVTGLIQGVALVACVWMIHKLNINWYEIFQLPTRLRSK